MNSREIAPVSFWKPEGDQIADTIVLYNFHGYNFDGSESIVSYRLGFTDANDKWVSLAESSVKIPDSVVQAWGEDDEPIFDFVIGELNLTKI